MSNLVFPTLIGQGWDISKTAEWSTNIHRSKNGKESRLARWSFPIWHFNLNYEVITDDGTTESDVRNILGFYNRMMGAFDTFLYRHEDDCILSNQVIGVGDGTSASFQLIRDYGGFVEPIRAVNTSTFKLYKDTTLVSNTGYTINDDGVVTLTSAPTTGTKIIVNGEFYHRVRFAEDSLEVSQFLYRLYELKQCELVSVK